MENISDCQYTRHDKLIFKLEFDLKNKHPRSSRHATSFAPLIMAIHGTQNEIALRKEIKKDAYTYIHLKKEKANFLSSL